LTQAELGNLIHVSVDEIKSIEISRRALDSVLDRVLNRTGAEWNGRRWVCAFELNEETAEWVRSDRKRPFKYLDFERFNRDREKRPRNADAQELAGSSRLSLLFTFVPDSEWWSLTLRFYRFVEECWRDYQGDKLVEIYNSVGQQGQFGTSASEAQRYM
jgi:hypothetical protein